MKKNTVAINTSLLAEKKGKMTNSDIAEKIGYSERTIYNIEKGDRMKIDAAKKLANILNVPIDELIKDDVKLVDINDLRDLKIEIDKIEESAKKFKKIAKKYE